MSAILNVLALLSSPLDLSWGLDNNTRHWITATPFQFTQQIVNENGDWYAMNNFETSEHTGTHLDAPYHFNKDGWKVADISLERLITHGILINVSSEVNGNTDFELSVKHIEDWETKHGSIPNNSVILIDFGWSKNYDSQEKYFGLKADSTHKLNFPGLSPEAARWIAQSNKIYGVGVDTASVDPGKSTKYEAHRTLSQKNIYLLEHVSLITQLPDKDFILIIMPMKITNGTGAPARIVAIPQKSSG